MSQTRQSGLLASAVALAICSAAFLPSAAVQAQTMSAPTTSTITTTTSSMVKKDDKKKLPDEMVEKQIKHIHDKLMITPDQESKWGDVASAMRDGASATSDLIRDRRANEDTMNAVDDLKSYQKIAEAHADSLKSLVPAFSTLYDTLSPAQKKAADEEFSHPPGAHPHKG